MRRLSSRLPPTTLSCVGRMPHDRSGFRGIKSGTTAHSGQIDRRAPKLGHLVACPTNEGLIRSSYRSDVPLKTDRPIHSSCTRHEPFLTREEQPAHEYCACCRVRGDRCDYPATSAHRLSCDGCPRSHRRLCEALAPHRTADRSDRGSKRSFCSGHPRERTARERRPRRIRSRGGRHRVPDRLPPDGYVGFLCGRLNPQYRAPEHRSTDHR